MHLGGRLRRCVQSRPNGSVTSHPLSSTTRGTAAATQNEAHGGCHDPAQRLELSTLGRVPARCGSYRVSAGVLLGSMDRPGGVDEADVGEGLGEVAEKPRVVRGDLF